MDVSRETTAALRLYHDLLLKWQAKINLISPGTVKDAWSRHFEDSLQLIPLIPAEASTLYDIGSGAGFPGLVLAISCPQIAVTLIESDAKKCAFLSAVSRETGVGVAVKNSRIEVAYALPVPDIITARALASLTELLVLISPWAAQNPSLTALFPKGERWAEEVEQARAAGWNFDYEAFPSVTERYARILKLTAITRDKA